MDLEEISLPNGSQWYCFRGKDALGVIEKKWICGTIRQDAVKFALIDLSEGKPSISHICKQEGKSGRSLFSCMSALGKERFKNFDEIELEELEYLEEQLDKHLNKSKE
jgi:hypothetical protein